MPLETYMGLPLADYQSRAAAWWSHNPWTVVLAKGKRNAPAGMVIVLPLSEKAYNRVRSGSLACYDVTPDDFQIPSNHLLIEACAENPKAKHDPSLDPPSVLLMCLALQISALMRYGRNNGSSKFHWLSFAGTPTSRERLQSTGFRATGQRMAKTGLELLERVLDFENDMGMRFLEAHILSWGCRACPPAPPID